MSRASSWPSRRPPRNWRRTSRSLGFDLHELVERRQAVPWTSAASSASEIEETGEYDLEGLFVRLGSRHRVGRRQAGRAGHHRGPVRRAAATTAILRAELRRLFRWLKDQGVTRRHHRRAGRRRPHPPRARGVRLATASSCSTTASSEQVSTRRLRVVKYRGSTHGTNEYPFLIDEQGLTVLPITSAGLEHAVSDERISSGIAAAGRHARRQGLLSRQQRAGLGHGRRPARAASSAQFADAACRRGERCMYFSFEESPNQIIRNMRLDRHRPGEAVATAGLLRFDAARPDPPRAGDAPGDHAQGRSREFQPHAVVVDPISNL